MYESSDLPDVITKPPSPAVINQNSEQGEMEDFYDTGLPDDPALIQEADRFDPSKSNPTFVPDVVESSVSGFQQPGNDYSYTYGHWGSSENPELDAL